jgi:glycerol kinase
VILAIEQGTSGTTSIVFDERDELPAGSHRAVSRSRGWAAGK